MATKRTATFTVTDMSTNKAISARANVIFPLADFYIKNEKGEKINEYKVGEHITLIIETEGEREKEFTIDLSEQDAIFEDENGQKVEDKFKKKVTGTEDLNLKLKVAQRKETKKRLRKITVTDDKETSKSNKAHCKEVGIWIVFGEGINDKYQYKNQKLNDVDGNETKVNEIDNNFIKNTVETLNGLINNKADSLNIIAKLTNCNGFVGIIEVSWSDKNSYDGKVRWSDQGGIVTDEGGRHSPALGLIHELGHAYVQYFQPLEKKPPSPSATIDEINEFMDWYEDAGEYTNKEEEYIIKNIENPAIKALNKVFPNNQQTIRLNHHWTHKFRATGGPFSTQGTELKAR